MKRTRLSRRLSAIVAAALAASLVAGAIAYAADIQTDVSPSLSTDVTLPTNVSIGSNAFQIKLSATGNLPSAQAPAVAQVVDTYNMDNAGNITPVSGSTTAVSFGALNYTTGCGGGSPPAGCANNPHVVNATLVVASGTPSGTTGTLQVSHTGANGLTADATPAVGYVEVVLACTNTATIQQPINSSGSSVFKKGSVIPVKIGVVDCNGDPVSGLSPDIALEKTAGGAGGVVNEAASSPAANTGTAMRETDVPGQYIYNLSTKNSVFAVGGGALDAPAQYTLSITGAGTFAPVGFGLK